MCNDEEKSAHVNVSQFVAARGDIHGQAAHVLAEIERQFGRPRDEPAGWIDAWRSEWISFHRPQCYLPQGIRVFVPVVSNRVASQRCYTLRCQHDGNRSGRAIAEVMHPGVLMVV